MTTGWRSLSRNGLPGPRTRAAGFARAGLALLVGVVLVAAVEPDDEPIDLALPSQIDLGKLTDLVGATLDLSLEYNPQRMRGTVRLDLRDRYRPAELWDAFNQVLLGSGFTTVVAGDPPLFHVVPLNEAANLGQVIPAEALADLASRFQPGYLSTVVSVDHLPGEQAIQMLGVLLGQSGQARTLGREGDRILVAGPNERVRGAVGLLAELDAPGLVPTFRQYRPRFATPQKLQTAVTAAWNAAGRLAGAPQAVEVQLTPDSERLLIVATQDAMPRILELVRELDQSEPATTETYRPRFFAPQDVADLIEQILEAEEGSDRISIVRDELTGSLVVRATEGQHRRIRRILDDLDQAPAAARRSMRQYQIKHRAVGDLATVLEQLLQQQAEVGAVADLDALLIAEGDAAPAPPVARPDALTPPDLTRPDGGRSAEPAAGERRARRDLGGELGDLQVALSTDELTNTLIAFGPPRILDQIEELIDRLDAKQAQVELEITMVSLSSSESFSLGVELAGEHQEGSLEGNVGSLFGNSTPANGGVGRTLNDFTGLGGLVINPGDWAVTFNALETLNEGRTVVTTRIVIDNNAEASIDGVDQRPVSSTSANQSASITGFGGTSDAGTQISVTPQIGAADQVTLTYAISQSSFVGESIQAGDGAVLPPPRRADTISSVATVPDGHVIALGGLVSARDSEGRSGVPFLGRIPVLGMLFRRESSDEGESRFYVFIRANVLRHTAFEDLKYLSAGERAEAGVDDGWPELQPRFLDE